MNKLKVLKCISFFGERPAETEFKWTFALRCVTLPHNIFFSIAIECWFLHDKKIIVFPFTWKNLWLKMLSEFYFSELKFGHSSSILFSGLKIRFLLTVSSVTMQGKYVKGNQQVCLGSFCYGYWSLFCFLTLSAAV